MALLQNITLNNQYPYRRSGGTAVNTETGNMMSQIGPCSGREFTRFLGGLPTISALPSGYNPGILMPLKHTQMSSWREADFTVRASGSGKMGIHSAGLSSIAIAASGTGQLIASAIGVASFAVISSATIQAALLGSGSASVSISASADITALGWITGASSLSVYATLEPYAVGSMAGTAYLAGGAIDELAILTRLEFGGYIHVDPVNGTVGTAKPLGTEAAPTKLLSHAIQIAEDNNLKKIKVLSPLTVAAGEDISGYIIKSDSWISVTLEPGSITNDTEFEKVSLYGEFSGDWNVLVDCWVFTITNFLGWMRGGSFETIYMAPYIIPNPTSLGSSYFDHIVPMYANRTAVVIMNTDISLSFTDCVEIIEIRDMDSSAVVNVTLAGGHITLDSSCTGGDFHISGTGTLTNNSLVPVFDSGLNNEDTAWNAIAIDNNTAGTMGNKLNTASSGGVDLNALAAAVWTDPSAVELTDESKFLIKTLKNKRTIEKEGSVWTLKIYDNDNITVILSKPLKDFLGNDITDLVAGVLAMEGKTIV